MGIKVISCFDGISCGMVALERAGIKVDRYVAYEIDKYAIQVSSKNYPNIEHKGDVTTADFTQYKDFDLLIGGSPCTYWSIAKKDRETTSDGIGFQLFMQFVRAWKESGCKYFLYENNFSIHKDIKAEISKKLGVEPIMINSALVSAQQRKRCYWTNIPGVQQPHDKGLLLKDILEDNVSMPICTKYGKSQTIKAQYANTSLANTQYSGSFGATMVAKPIKLGKIGKGGQGQRIYSVSGKSVCLGTGGSIHEKYKINLPDGDYIIRKLTPVEAERLQTLPDNYTAGISNTQRYKCNGNGWTVDVIAHILGGLNNA